MTNSAESEDTAVTQSLSSPSEEISTQSETADNLSNAEESTDYSALTVAELRELAKERNLSGYSTLTKSELIALLEANDG